MMVMKLIKLIFASWRCHLDFSSSAFAWQDDPIRMMFLQMFFFDKLRGNKANLVIAHLPVLWYLYVEVFCLHHVYIVATFFGTCRYM